MDFFVYIGHVTIFSCMLFSSKTRVRIRFSVGLLVGMHTYLWAYYFVFIATVLFISSLASTADLA